MARSGSLSIIAAVTAVGFFAVYLWRFDYGLISLNTGVDWANHMWMVDIAFHGESFDSPEVMRLIGFWVIYPHSAHTLAAWLAWATGASPLQTIHWLGNAAVIASAAIVAGQIAAVMGQAKHLASALLAGVAGIGVLHVSAAWGIGFSQQLQWNFFYPQAVGIALGLGALRGFQHLARNRRFLLLLLASAVTAFILITFHPTPAAWAAACGTVCAFSIRGSVAARLARAAATGSLSVGVMLLLPNVRRGFGLVSKGVGGDVNLWSQVLNLSLHPSLLMAALALLAALLLVAVALYGWDEALRTHASAGAIVGCGFFAAAILFSVGTNDFYSIAKYNAIYGHALSVLIASIVLWFADRWLPASSGRAVPAVAAMAIPAAVLAQQVYVTAHVRDQRKLIEARALAEAGLLRDVLRWPNNVERYYLAGSALKEPMPDAVEYLFGRRPYSIGQTIDFSRSGDSDTLVGTGWSAQEGNFRWTIGSRADIKFRLRHSATEHFTLRFAGAAFLAEARPRQSVTVMVNGHEAARFSFEAGQPPPDMTVPVDGKWLGADRQILIALLIGEPRSPKELGLLADPRALGIHLRSISIEPSTSPAAAR